MRCFFVTILKLMWYFYHSSRWRLRVPCQLVCDIWFCRTLMTQMTISNHLKLHCAVLFHLQMTLCETEPEGSADESDQEPQLEDETEFESNVCIFLLCAPLYSTRIQCVFLLFSQTSDSGPQANMWFGYKFVGDNIDKSIKPSLQRHKLRGQSLHFFHGYAVRDRVDLSKLSDKPPPFSTPEPSVFLPSPDDLSCLREELEILVSR